MIALAGRWVAVGEGTQTIPLVYIDDVVDALLLAAEAPGAVGEIFNVVDTRPSHPAAIPRPRAAQARQRTARDARADRIFMLLGFGVELLGKLLRRDVPLTRYRVRSLRPLANFDLTAARTKLGWEPRTGVQRGLDITFG